MFFGPITREENKHLKDINAREMLVLAPLVIAIVVGGVAPNIMLDQMHGAVGRVLEDYESRAKAGTGGKYYDGPIRLTPRKADAPQPLAVTATSAEGDAQ
jgi:NADH-quinone oxidoreductase subunit M